MCVATRAGAVDPQSYQGLYHRDIRLVSRLETRLNGRTPTLLAAHRDGASTAYQVFTAATDARGSPSALLLRRREVGTGVRDTYEFRVFEGAGEDFELVVQLGHDFADLQAVRKSVEAQPPVAPEPFEGGWRVGKGSLGLDVQAEGELPDVGDQTLTWRPHVKPGQAWRTVVHLRPRYDAASVDERAAAPPAVSRLRVESGATRWRAAVASALGDLHALRVHLPDLDLSYIGAGAPWFMALFGRDTLITALETLIAGSTGGLEVLEALARYQGRTYDAETREQPGRIPHELRTGGTEVFGVASGKPYYGTVDASPLFVVLLDEVSRWGGDAERVRALLPAARAAAAWCGEHGDIDADGYVEYESDPEGLANQGWKDSGDAMVHADGRQAATPLALAEVQAYVWAAYQALARLEERLGDPAHAGVLRARADALRTAFHRDFWLPDRGIVAMGLDADKRPLAVASSNMGHCLWAGILDDATGDAVARRLAEPDLLSSWGVRTLAATEAAYNPLSYHLGSVWPHDSALVAAGLVRYGHVRAGGRIASGLLAAAEHFDWRLPELLGGIDATDLPYPVPYPVACSPQAWSASVPLLLLRTMLRLDPDVPAGRVHVAPILPDDVALHITGIPLGDGALDLRVHGRHIEVLGCPDGLEIVDGPRT